MKKLLSVFLVSTIVTICTGCPASDQNSTVASTTSSITEAANRYQEVLVGQWKREGKDWVYFDFKDNGRLEHKYSERMGSSGTWTITSAGSLRLNFVSIKDQNAVVEIIDEDTLYFSNPNDSSQSFKLYRVK